MKLLSLEVENYGLFHGTHTFDLSTEHEAGNTVIFSGTNGSGKTTLFRALPFALYGALSLGDKVTQLQYLDFLAHRLHRQSVDGKTEVSQRAKVILEFSLVQSGRPTVIRVARNWHRLRQSIVESLDIWQDGKPIAVPTEGSQAWLSDIVPPSQSLLCFFDAEELETLANPDQANRALGDMVKKLLGIDLVDRLSADLEQFTAKNGGPSRANRDNNAAPQLQMELDYLTEQIETSHVALLELNDTETGLRAALASEERRLAAEGGHYATERPIMQVRHDRVQVELENIATRLRDDCSHLLPFTLCPELCERLSVSLANESDLQRNRVVREFWCQRVSEIEHALQAEMTWAELDLDEQRRTIIAERLREVLRLNDGEFANLEDASVHQLSEPERVKLQELIQLARYEIVNGVVARSEKLKELTAEQRQIVQDLNRVPDEEVLAPIHAEIVRIQSSLSELGRDQAKIVERIGSLTYQRTEKERQKNKAAEELEASQAATLRLRLADRSKLVLKAFKDALIRERIKELEVALVRRFNILCQKDNLLQSITIDPDDFTMELRNTDGHELALSSFSAGERQLYVFALLWALRDVSGQSLPLAVDTPVARLDEVHRLRVMQAFIPEVSTQVLLFATNAELDSDALIQAATTNARVYELSYGSMSGNTTAAVVQTHDSLLAVS